MAVTQHRSSWPIGLRRELMIIDIQLAIQTNMNRGMCDREQRMKRLVITRAQKEVYWSFR